MDNILYINDASKLSKFHTHPQATVFSPFLRQWATEKKVVALLRVVNNKTVGFMLLRQVDYDPLHIHKNPWVLDFIFVDVKHRRKGYGCDLLDGMKRHKIEEVTAFMVEPEAIGLLRKNGFTGNSSIMRHNRGK